MEKAKKTKKDDEQLDNKGNESGNIADLKEARKQARISQEESEKKTGLKKSHISKLEDG